jgi:hypothetical protein
MPPCYTFNKICLPDDGRSLCGGSGAGIAPCDTVTWFWLLTAVVVGGVVLANVGKS